ncbi:hypothetical protein M0804_000004 [Polistes exclamans]|nr:hypothetical protein M0804_000004 [Polistes exclamans]
MNGADAATGAAVAAAVGSDGVSEYCAPNRLPCHFDRILGTRTEIPRENRGWPINRKLDSPLAQAFPFCLSRRAKPPSNSYRYIPMWHKIWYIIRLKKLKGIIGKALTSLLYTRVEGELWGQVTQCLSSEEEEGILSMLRRNPFAYQEERSSKERHAYLTKSGLRILMVVLSELYGRTSRRTNRRSFQIRALRDPDELFGI